MFPSRPFFTIPNLLSIGRLLLLFPLYYFLREGERDDGNHWALVIMGVALLSDLLDGMLARALNQESEWGKILDPVADKVWIGFLALFLAMPWREHPLSWMFLALVLVRDGAIVLCAIYAFRRTGVVMKSNWAGKIAMVFAAVTLISYTIYWTPSWLPWLRPEMLMWLTVALLLLSGGVYLHRFQKVLAQQAHRNSSLKTGA